MVLFYSYHSVLSNIMLGDNKLPILAWPQFYNDCSCAVRYVGYTRPDFMQ